MVATIVAWVDVSSHARQNNTVAISNTLTPFPQLEGGWLPPNMRNETHLVTETPIEWGLNEGSRRLGGTNLGGEGIDRRRYTPLASHDQHTALPQPQDRSSKIGLVDCHGNETAGLATRLES